MQYLQRVLPLMDARDRMASGARHHPRGADPGGVRPPAGVARRGALEGLLALRDRLEAVSEESARAARGALAAAAAAGGRRGRAARGRGRRALRRVREPLPRRARRDPRAPAPYVDALREAWRPSSDLGCGRGEFLELLREAGIAARGVEANAHAAARVPRRAAST